MSEDHGPKLLKLPQKQQDNYLEIITNSLMDGDPILYVSAKKNKGQVPGNITQEDYFIQAFINGDRRVVTEAMIGALRSSKDFLLVIAYVAGKELIQNPNFFQAVKNAQMEMKKNSG